MPSPLRTGITGQDGSTRGIPLTLTTEPSRQLAASKRSQTLRYLPAPAVAIDVLVVAGAVAVAALGRERLGFFDVPTNISSNLTVAGPLVTFEWILTIALLGGYSKDVFGAGTDEYKRIVNATLITAGLVGITCYLANYPLSRGFFVLAFLIGMPALVIGRRLLRRAIHQARKQGLLLHRVVMAGDPTHIDEIAGILHRESWLGYHIVGAVTPAHELSAATESGIPVLGNVDDVASVVDEMGADVVFFAAGAFASSTQTRRVVWDLEHHDVQVVVAPSFTDVSRERVRIRPVGGLPLVHIEKPSTIDASRWAKRTFDILGSGTLIAVFSPLLALSALRIKACDGGAILFRQTRVGRDGAEFACFKFRTMVMNAEAMVAQLQEEQGVSALLFKMKNDPRITRPGAWMRRYSVDELPQLFNVFRGDMSLIGPRPQVPQEVALYNGHMSRRLHVRPGMTGLWQVSGRNDLSVQDAIRLDLYYVDNWSMIQDLTILFRTFSAVFGSRGAY